MIVGNPRTFAIEAGISLAYERLSLRALGYIVIHLGGLIYGVRAPDATCLACSFDEVVRRKQGRGSHSVDFAEEPDAGKLVDAVGACIYGVGKGTEEFLGRARSLLRESLHERHVLWAPDGDQAFDDGSHVLQFDVGDRVRLVGFRMNGDHSHEPASLRDVWIKEELFYEILGEWQTAFELGWSALPKVGD